jgi:tetratricopeptide (TPR) repeat protein/tRNA A-37 threonylcarbamoyl transferase component Bud32
MADLTGKTLGKYRLVERLGRGGMAEVYKAYQPNLDRYVAIKLMHAYLAEDEDFVGRFQREAKAIGSLRHPHIVQVYDSDIEEDVYYMVQEYIDGGTLKARLREANERGKTIPLEETVRILEAVCSAVDYAHAQGRIHRDIKPDNIMFDSDDRPVLTDFGIASIVGGERYTATGAMIGTPAYMSPEQGKGDPNDYRSDIYSLGVVLYEMVTGRVPFDADTPFAVVLKHLNEALPMPSAINPGLNPAIERVILKAMAKEAEDRYQSAGALAEDLREAVRGPEPWEWETATETLAAEVTSEEPAVEAPLVPPETAAAPAVELPLAAEEGGRAAEAAAQPKRKRRTWLWIAVPAVALLLVACCLFAVAANQAKKAKEAAGMAEAEPTRILSADVATETEPTWTLSADVASLIQVGYETLGEECGGDVDGAARLFERALEQDENVVPAYVGLARCSMCDGRSEDALGYLDKAVNLAPADALPYLVRGQLWLYEEEGDKAMADLTRAIELDPDSGEAYFWRGAAANYPLEDYEQAYADLSKAIELAPDLHQAYLMRGQILHWHRDAADAALADFSKYVELAPEDPSGYYARGEVYLDSLGDYESAVAEFTRAIELDPTDGTLYRLRAWAFMQQRDLDAAIDDLSSAIDLGPTSDLYLTRGMAYYYSGQYEEALADMDKALLIGDSYPGAAHHGKGWVYYAMGRYEEAVQAYTEASQDNWEDYAWPFFEDSHWLLDRGIAYRALGQYEQALADHEALVDLWDSWFRGYYERGLTYRLLGREEEAMADLRQALEYVDDAAWRERIMQALENKE